MSQKSHRHVNDAVRSMLAANGASIYPESQVSLPRFTETLAEEYTPRGPRFVEESNQCN